jgi:O-acetyl-ADP-ribose deacetylase
MDRIYRLPYDRVIRLTEGDITRIPADAIVNAANSSLAGGGGVDGAIHRAGGPAIMAELDQIRAHIRRLPAGHAVATSAGNLPARWVFHAVGPVYNDGLSGEPEELASCYRVSLEMAGERNCRSLSFPAISTGVYHFPFDAAASIAVREVKTFLNSCASSVQEVIFVQFGSDAYARYQALLDASGD